MRKGTAGSTVVCRHPAGDAATRRQTKTKGLATRWRLSLPVLTGTDGRLGDEKKISTQKGSSPQTTGRLMTYPLKQAVKTSV